MIIAIRKEKNGLIYMDKNICGDKRFEDIDITKAPYNYTKVEVNDAYIDCVGKDFNEDLSFSVEKYNARKLKEFNSERIIELKQKLKETDYKAIKFAEGQISAEEYEPIKLQRQAWRSEINLIEGK